MAGLGRSRRGRVCLEKQLGFDRDADELWVHVSGTLERTDLETSYFRAINAII